MGLPRDQVARIRTAAAIHDVGKINTPKAILHKPGRLTDEEYEVIKRHPGEGAEMGGVLERPGDRRDRPPPPRAARRQRLPQRAAGRGDPARRPDRRRRRHLRRDHLRAALPRGQRPQERDRHPQAGGRHAPGPRRRQGLLQLLRRPSAAGPLVVPRRPARAVPDLAGRRRRQRRTRPPRSPRSPPSSAARPPPPPL